MTNKNIRRDLLNNKVWLKQKYDDEMLSTYKIAKECKCSQGTVSEYLKKFGIEIRIRNESQNPHARWDLLNNKGWLSKKYEVEKLSTVQIAEECKRSFKLISMQLKKFGIETRETKGENSNFWKGGITDNPYCEKWTTSLKEKVRNRNDRVCYLCGKTEEENGKKLSVHHIDYNKMQGCFDNGQTKRYRWNLKPLCSSCHTKTNFNRYYWFNLLYNNWVFDNVTEGKLFYNFVFYPLC